MQMQFNLTEMSENCAAATDDGDATLTAIQIELDSLKHAESWASELPFTCTNQTEKPKKCFLICVLISAIGFRNHKLLD